MKADTSRVVLECAVAPDQPSRVDVLLKKIPEGHGVAGFVSEVDRNAVLSPAYSLVFHTLVDLRGYADRLEGVSYRQLLKETEPLDHELVTIWNTMETLSDAERAVFLSKASLLLEVACLAWQDAVNDGRVTGSYSGSSVLAPLCSADSISSQVLSTDVSSWPSGIRKKIEEVLEELDFAQTKTGNWEYRIDIDSRQRLSSASNIKAYVRTGSVALSPLALARLSQQLLTRLSLLQRTISMYPADHPSIPPALSSFVELLNSFINDETNIIAITILGGEIMVNNIKVKSKTKMVQVFRSHLMDRGINSISFRPGINEDELLAFVELLNRKPSHIKERKGLNEMCRKRGIEHISVDEFRYALVAKDGKLVSEAVSAPLENTLGDIVFRELIDRLKKGDSIDGIPSEQLGRALTSILSEASDGSLKYRSMLADFVAALDPSVLEKGLMVSRELHDSLAWSTLRKIIEKNINDLNSSDTDRIIDALDRLNNLACVGAERGKLHTVMHITDTVREKLFSGSLAPEALFASLILLGSVAERLVTTNRLASAAELTEVLDACNMLPTPLPVYASALRRGLAEARRRIDTPDASDVILEAFMGSDERSFEAAEKITGVVLFRNLETRLVDLFLERKREVRARVYSVLRRFGASYLSMFHSRIQEIEDGCLSVRDSETGRFANQDWYLMRNLIALLGELGSEESTPLLSKLCSDPDDRVRKIALAALVKTSKKQAVAHAHEMIEDHSSDVVSVSLDILADSDAADYSLIPLMLRLMHKLPASRKSILRYLTRVSDDPAVLRYLRDVFYTSKGTPFDDNYLLEKSLSIFVKFGKTEEIKALQHFLSKNSGGTLKRASAPDYVLEDVSATIELMRRSHRKEKPSAT